MHDPARAPEQNVLMRATEFQGGNDRLTTGKLRHARVRTGNIRVIK